MTYEEYLVEFERIIVNICMKYGGLHNEFEDRLQECYLVLFTKLDKLNELEDMHHKKAYFKKSLDGHFKKMNVEEHKQQLFNITSFDDWKSDKKDEVLPDDFMERFRLYKNQKSREWYARNREKKLAYMKEYAKEQKADIKRYHQLYDKVRYIKNKEEMNKKSREYYKEHKDEINEKRREYYKEHKDEINKKRRLKKQQEKELRENDNKKY